MGAGPGWPANRLHRLVPTPERCAATVSLWEALIPDASVTHGQVTDIYLLALAVAHGGRLATLDRHIPVTVVPGGSAGLEIIPA